MSEVGDPDALSPPATVTWPAGFDKMFALARPGAIRSSDLDQVLAIAADSPHHAFPLRAIRETEYALRSIRHPSERIGTIDLEKALREAYPGATYFHNRRAYRIVQWRTTAYDHSIMLEPVEGRQITHALLTSAISVSTGPGQLLDDNFLESEHGMLAQMIMRVADSVEGYAFGSVTHCYADLRGTDWRMTRRLREFSTIGVLLRIQEKWFARSGVAP